MISGKIHWVFPAVFCGTLSTTSWIPWNSIILNSHQNNQVFKMWDWGSKWFYLYIPVHVIILGCTIPLISYLNTVCLVLCLIKTTQFLKYIKIYISVYVFWKHRHTHHIKCVHIYSALKCTHLSILTLAVPAWIQVADTCAQRAGDRVAGLSVILWDAVVYSIHLLYKVLVELRAIQRDTWQKQQKLWTCTDRRHRDYSVLINSHLVTEDAALLRDEVLLQNSNIQEAEKAEEKSCVVLKSQLFSTSKGRPPKCWHFTRGLRVELSFGAKIKAWVCLNWPMCDILK